MVPVRAALSGWATAASFRPDVSAKPRTSASSAAAFLFAERPLALDEKAEKELDAAARTRLGALLGSLQAAKSWDTATLEALVRGFADTSGLKLAAVAQPLRAALTGTTVSPPVFDVMAALGREEALGRIRDQAR